VKRRYIIGGAVMVVFLGIGGYSFLNSSVEYATISKAESTGRKVQISGTCVKDMGSAYDAGSNSFTFYLKDADQRVTKVILAGAKPNNFDIATSVVAKGRYEDGCFHAEAVLTKCPSKYESNPGSTHPADVNVPG
jgi:cytochrome c-type biogenesis protein CcmE